MVASIPLASEIVTTTTLALGSKELSHHGAIVTRLSAIEDMAGMAILCSDKTGTMTLNKMQLQPEAPIYCKGESQYSLLRYAFVLFFICNCVKSEYSPNVDLKPTPLIADLTFLYPIHTVTDTQLWRQNGKSQQRTLWTH